MFQGRLMRVCNLMVLIFDVILYSGFLINHYNLFKVGVLEGKLCKDC